MANDDDDDARLTPSFNHLVTHSAQETESGINSEMAQ
jgi:hypothetical protein